MAQLTDIVVGQGSPTGRQKEVAIAFDKMVGGDQLDPEPGPLGEDVHVS